MRAIIVDGADGAGKTTFCKLLQERKGWRYVKFPLEYPRRHFTSPDANADYYLAEFKKVCEELGKNRDRTTIIFDRSYISTYIYQGQNDPMLGKRIIEEGRQAFSRLNAELSYVILAVDPQTACERILGRPKQEVIDSIDELAGKELFERCTSLYKSYNTLPLVLEVERPTLIKIDTSDTGPQEAVEHFLNIWEDM